MFEDIIVGVLCRQGFSSSVLLGGDKGDLNIYRKGCSVMLERMAGWFTQEDRTHNAIPTLN